MGASADRPLLPPALRPSLKPFNEPRFGPFSDGPDRELKANLLAIVRRGKDNALAIWLGEV